MFTPSQQLPPDKSRFAQVSQALQDATIHSKYISAKKHIPKTLSRAAFLVLSIVSSSVFAAAPLNDQSINAIEVFSGSTYNANTTEATSDSDDAQFANESDLANCGIPSTVTAASVWYEYTASSDVLLVIDAWNSSYTPGFLVGTGSPGNLNLQTCQAYYLQFNAIADQTYYILIFDSRLGQNENGGELEFNVNEYLIPTVENFTVNSIGKFNPKLGTATISGSFTCSNSEFFDVYANAVQKVGRFLIRGSGSFVDNEQPCDGTAKRWTIMLEPDTGILGGGTANVSVGYFTCNYQCAEGVIEQKIKLRGGPKN